MKKIEEVFTNLWKREEAHYIHFTKGKPKTQMQFACRQHWLFLKKIIGKRGKSLEVGCGRGTMSAYFSDNGWDATLMDTSQNILIEAKRMFNKLKLKGEFVSSISGKFDLVFSMGLLEHFKNPEKLIREQVKALKDGGIFFAYIVPENPDNVQSDYKWVNDILKGYVETKKKPLYRTDYKSIYYKKILKKLKIKDIRSCGVYPLPLISHSPEFPFSLMPPKSEKAIVEFFTKALKYWVCAEDFGRDFIYGVGNEKIDSYMLPRPHYQIILPTECGGIFDRG